MKMNAVNTDGQRLNSAATKQHSDKAGHPHTFFATFARFHNNASDESAELHKGMDAAVRDGFRGGGVSAVLGGKVPAAGRQCGGAGHHGADAGADIRNTVRNVLQDTSA